MVKRVGAKQKTERHLGMPWNEWQQKKRQQWNLVMRSLSAFEFGCAYTPAANDLFVLRQCADRIDQAMSEDWVSW